MIYNFKKKQILEEEKFNSERELHEFISENCELFFGVNVIANEYVITFFDNTILQQQTGRIDTLGIDENGAPVIIEYKLEKSSNLINQALYYKDWLVNNKRQFELEVKNTKVNRDIDWNNLRVICIAKYFNKYDYNAIRQIDANVELYQYNKYDEIFELLEVYNKVKVQKPRVQAASDETEVTLKNSYTLVEELPSNIKDLYEELRTAYEENYGDKLDVKFQKHYVAFKLLKNILCIVPKKKGLQVYTNNVKKEYVDQFKDVTNLGHWGTCNYTVLISNKEELKEFLDAIKF